MRLAVDGAVGNGVVPIYPRHPAMMAQAALSVSELTRGRFRLGIGVGAWLGTLAILLFGLVLYPYVYLTVRASFLMQSFFDGITRSLKKGQPITFVGFGTFKTAQRKARIAAHELFDDLAAAGAFTLCDDTQLAVLTISVSIQ